MIEFNVDSFKGFLLDLAQKIDQKGDNNQKINGYELSIFFLGANKLKINGKISAEEYNSIFGVNQIVEQQNDKIFFKQPQTITISTSKSADYKDHPKYQYTLNIVKRHMDAKNPMDKSKGGEKYNERAEYATKLILEKCQKYDIEDLIPLVADMLGTECGGYQFEADTIVNGRKIGNGKRSKQKGVMQVNLQACQIIYGEGKCKYDHDHYCQQDIDRINELKQKYPTARELFDAQRKDPELGLEVGILTLKFKIRSKKGDVKLGLAAYCGNQYKCDDPTVPQKIDLGKRS